MLRLRGLSHRPSPNRSLARLVGVVSSTYLCTRCLESEHSLSITPSRLRYIIVEKNLRYQSHPLFWETRIPQLNPQGRKCGVDVGAPYSYWHFIRIRGLPYRISNGR